MITPRAPQDRPEPPAYHPAVEVSGPVRTLYVSGQVGVRPDGTVPDGIEAQARQVYDNLGAVLAAAGMGLADVVKTTVFLLNPADRPAFSAIRTAAMAGRKTASTLVYVSGLADPAWLVEVEVVAVQDAVQEATP